LGHGLQRSIHEFGRGLLRLYKFHTLHNTDYERIGKSGFEETGTSAPALSPLSYNVSHASRT
jgi:hypothetical protein